MSSNLAYQDARSEELIGGRVVMMAPASTDHNRIARNIFGIFWGYLKGKKCEPFGDGEAVYLTDVDHFIPDMMVVCDPDKVKWDGVHGAPDLVVEVLSPSTAKNDRCRKWDVYESCGVREYWLVSPGEKSVEVYLLEDGKYTLLDVYTVRPDWMLAHMTEEERAAVATHFKCSLFDDLDISLEDIFYRTV